MILEEQKLFVLSARNLFAQWRKNAQPKGIHFWCTRCKEEFELKEIRRYRAHEADD